MKCVKDKATQAIKRVSNEIGQALVDKGTHTFSSKSAWKSEVRDAKPTTTKEA